jgi:hypothetical protein
MQNWVMGLQQNICQLREKQKSPNITIAYLIAGILQDQPWPCFGTKLERSGSAGGLPTLLRPVFNAS